MRKLLLLIPLLSLSAYGQVQITNAPPAGWQDFANTVFGYFTSFNTNLDYTFRDTHFDLWMGVASSQRSLHPLMNDIGGSYDFYKPTPSTNSEVSTALSIEVDTRNEGVAGSLVSVQLGPGFSLIVHDAKLTLYADGGTYLDKGIRASDRWFGEIGLRVKKAWGRHFYGGVGVAAQFPRNDQVFSAFAGATF